MNLKKTISLAVCFAVIVLAATVALADGFPVCPENCGVTFNKKTPVTPKFETKKKNRLSAYLW